MTTDDNGSDRTPARRAVPTLIGLGLLLLIAWLLLAIDRQGQSRPQPGTAGPPGPSTLSIPRIGVRAAIVGVGLEANGAMQTPDPGQVGWYFDGPRPGDPGPAVLVGHVDTRTGPDVFYRLRQLRPGDEVLVGRPDGTTTRFLVGRLERHPKTALPTGRIWTSSNRPLLRLITCAGTFDRATRHYRDNLIVYASPD
jgi:Sortase domain